MLSPSNLRIFVSSQPADMRKSFDGLSCIVRQFLSQDPTSGQVFVFFNKRRDQVKALWWDLTGYAIWYKRLEAGCFHPGSNQGVISHVELSLILEGIEIKQARRFRRFHLRESIV
jgi:transposase